MSSINLYKILKLNNDASFEDINNSYLILIKKFEKDNKELLLIKIEYNILSNNILKDIYDKSQINTFIELKKNNNNKINIEIKNEFNELINNFNINKFNKLFKYYNERDFEIEDYKTKLSQYEINKKIEDYNNNKFIIPKYFNKFNANIWNNFFKKYSTDKIFNEYDFDNSFILDDDKFKYYNENKKYFNNSPEFDNYKLLNLNILFKEYLNEYLNETNKLKNLKENEFTKELSETEKDFPELFNNLIDIFKLYNINI